MRIRHQVQIRWLKKRQRDLSDLLNPATEKKRVTGRPNDGRTDFLTDKKRETDHGPTDGRTDRPSYRDAWAVQKKKGGGPSTRPSARHVNSKTRLRQTHEAETQVL